MAFRFRHQSLVREYTFPSKCYPRFRYFQKHYEGLLPELKKAEEYATLYKIDSPEYKSLSDRNYDSIDVTVICNANIANKPLASKLVKVQVSAKVDIEEKIAAKKDDEDKQVSANLDDEKQVSANLDVEKQDEHEPPLQFFDWDAHQRGRIDKKVLNITVFMINEKKDLAEFESFIPSLMSEERMENAVLHDVESNVSSTYEDMVKNNFKFKYDEEHKTPTLSSTIQHILEYNVVSLLDEIVKFTCHIEDAFYKPVLLNCYAELVAKMDPRLVIDQFQVIEFLPSETLEGLRKEITTPDKNRKIVDKVLTKGTKGYMAFKKCFTKTGQNELLTLLSGCEVRLSQDVKELKRTMKTMKFEIFGLLKQTRIDKIRTSVPTCLELKSDLRMDILKIDGIIGCGIEYNMLVMHMSRIKHPEGPSKSIKHKIKQLLEKRFSFDYSIELIDEITELGFKHGDTTYATQNTLTMVNFEMVGLPTVGTLGCFINVRHGETNKLVGITCAHCVEDCKPKVVIKGTSIPNDIMMMTGTCSHCVYVDGLVDIAAIEISEAFNVDCNTSLIDENGKILQNWTFERGNPALFLEVYKCGSRTGYTKGTITGTYNFRDSLTHEPSIQIRSSSTRSGPFSDNGDSGAVAWYEILGDDEETTFKVIGLVTKGNGTEHSICYPIKHSIQELERVSNWKIEEVMFA